MIPISRAVLATFSGPTSSVRRAYTVLSELSVALAIGTEPRYEWLYVATSQASEFGSGCQWNGAER